MAADPLFASDRVAFATLRARAWNHRWAVQPEGVIPLTAADPDFPVADEILAAMREYLRPGYLSYGPAEGLPAVRTAAARRFRERRGIDCGDNRILATNGAASALYLVAQRTLGPGDEALVADPCDFLFERAVSAAGGIVRRYPCHGFDAREVERAVTSRTRLLTICNPHNPLGRVWRREELQALADLARRHDLWILSDEVWADIIFAPNEHTSIAALGPEMARRTFTVYGFSKGYGLAGLRLGLVVSPSAEEHRSLVAASHADETAYGVSTLSQVAGIAAFERADDWLARFVAHLQRQRDHAVARLNRMDGVRCHLPEGTYVVFPDVSALGVEVAEIAERLRRHHGVAVVPGSPEFFGPGARGHLRLSIATVARAPRRRADPAPERSRRASSRPAAGLTQRSRACGFLAARVSISGLG
jgi:aspartate/methionine/tyrosine aminotransferase